MGPIVNWKARDLCLVLFGLAYPANPQRTARVIQGTPGVGYWIDSSTGFMWTPRDSGKDLSWRGAVKYCRNLRQAGYTDWRLANLLELQHLYDSKVNAPGLAGLHSEEPVMGHIRGNIFVTAYEWAGRLDGRVPMDDYEYYFDFNEGKSNDQETSFFQFF